MALVFLVNKAFHAYEILMLARIAFGWTAGFGLFRLPSSLWRPLVRWTDPVFEPSRALFRALLRAAGVDVDRSPIDFSPVVAFAFVDMLRWLAVSILLFFIG